MIAVNQPTLLLAALVAWVAALAFARLPRLGTRWPVLPVLAALIGAGCAILALRLPLDGQALSLETAFLAAWLLVGLQLLRDRLDWRSLALTARDGLLAIGALALAVEASRLLGPAGVYLSDGRIPAELAFWATLGAAFAVGHALCSIATPERHPWDYAVCFAASVIVMGDLHPAFAELAPTRFYGAATLGAALAASAALYPLAGHSRWSAALVSRRLRQGFRRQVIGP